MGAAGEVWHRYAEVAEWQPSSCSVAAAVEAAAGEPAAELRCSGSAVAFPAAAEVVADELTWLLLPLELLMPS